MIRALMALALLTLAGMATGVGVTLLSLRWDAAPTLAAAGVLALAYGGERCHRSAHPRIAHLSPARMPCYANCAQT